MISFIFAVLIISSVIISIFTGNAENVTESLLTDPVNAFELCIYLCGGMCFWGGLMRIAEKSGVTNALAKLFSFLLGGLFKNLDKNGQAFHAVCMNITANLLGLGNAATPFGIEAMKAIKKEENAKDTATPSMIIFTVLNTASITLIPSTVMSLRVKYGSANPLEILPAVWITSISALAVSLIIALVFNIKAKEKPYVNSSDNPSDMRRDNHCSGSKKS